jgi:zinc protease
MSGVAHRTVTRARRDARVVAAAGALVGVLAVTATVLVAQEAGWPRERPPAPLAAREVNFPPYEVRTLENGLRVVAVAHHEQPVISLRLLVGAGSVKESAARAGIADMAAQLLTRGTANRTANEIADQIDSIGGALSAGSGPDLTFISGLVMVDSFDFGLELVSDVARNPAFTPDEIVRQKEQALSALQVNANDPDYLASIVWDRLVYGFHPYGLPNSGTEETLLAITPGDLRAYHDTYFVPNNAILAVVGDVTSDDAFAAVERVFGDWAPAPLPLASVTPPPPAAARVVVVDMPGAVQTEVRVGHLGIPRNHEDFTAFDLAAKILGGEGGNRLHRVLRTQRGLTYGASADAEAQKDAGDLLAETDTRTETTGEVLRLMVEEIVRLRNTPVGSRELADAQAYLAGNFPLTVETPNQIATQVLANVFYELPIAEIETFRERVQAVTPDDIARVARAYLQPERLSIVLVGDASGFVGQLAGVGFDDVEVIPLAELDLMSASLRRAPAGAVATAR